MSNFNTAYNCNFFNALTDCIFCLSQSFNTYLNIMLNSRKASSDTPLLFL